MNEAPQKASFFSRLKAGLSKSSSKISEGITGIFTKRKLDAEALDELEELLIQADMGVQASQEMTQALAKDRFNKDISTEEVKDFLANHIAGILTPYAKPLLPESPPKPYVVVVVGVNGNGKTTSIGKIAHQFKSEGKSVMLAAADTFRAAAVEQLEVWANRAGIPMVKGKFESDPASVAYQALEEARARGVDVLLIDTAGRLQNKSNLMDELKKIIKVLKKLDEQVPHAVVQVLDATTGQNALSQVEVFKEMVDVNGLVLTKLDGTAKGGVLVALVKKYQIPVHFIGIGEKIEDLMVFSPQDYAANLVKSAA